MKRILTFLLILVISLSFVACGGESSNNNESKKEDSKVERPADLPIGEVEVTLENWQKYFDMVEIVEARTNAFDEVENAWVTIHISLKEEYASFCADSKIAFEIVLTEPQLCTVDGNYKTGKFEIKKIYTLDELKAQGNEHLLEMFAESKSMGEYNIYKNLKDDGMNLKYHYPVNDTLSASGDNVEFDTVMYKKSEISRVGGTLTFVEKAINKLEF